MNSSVSDYSPQAVFDATVRHLASMPGPSMKKRSTGGMCAYRGRGGRRCAVGLWIPDEKYDPSIESISVNESYGSRRVQECLPEPLRTKPMLRLLGYLQQAHDCCRNHWQKTDEWNKPMLAESLRNIARKRKLRTGVIKECFP